jgi:hypothetical protein
MDGRVFLALARQLVRQTGEEWWRNTTGRAYYGLMLEGRDALARWGFTPPRGDNVHAFVRLRFTYAADPDLQKVGKTLDRLTGWRNRADYNLTAPEFSNDARAQDAITGATAALALLDAVDADAARRAAVIADIRARWP